MSKNCQCEMPTWKPEDLIHCACCGKLLPDVKEEPKMGENKFNIGDGVDVMLKGVVTGVEEREYGKKKVMLYTVKAVFSANKLSYGGAVVTEDKLCLLETPKGGQK